MMYPWNGRSRGDDDQGRLLEKGRRIYYLRFSCNSFLSISSVRNETGRSMLDRYFHDKRLSRLAVQVESYLASWRESLKRLFGGFLVAEIYFRFLSGEARDTWKREFD